MNQQQPAKVKIDSTGAFPIVTCMLMVLMLVVYYQSSTIPNNRFFDSMGHGVRATDALLAVQEQKWDKIIAMLSGNFGSIHYIQLFFNLYFFWVFSNHTESKIGAGRLMFLSLLGSTLPWIAVVYSSMGSDTIYFGPTHLLCAILGAYFVIPPERSKIKSWMPKGRGQIFNKEEKKSMTEVYNKDPMIFVWVFVGVQIAFHFACTYFYPGYDTLNIFGVITAFGIGYGIGYMLLAAATGNVNDSPMRMNVLRHYRKLIEIDVPPEQALMGTAKSLGLPFEQVRDIVHKDKGKMRVS
jgi:membrane associated rhomboid family serine protease